MNQLAVKITLVVIAFAISSANATTWPQLGIGKLFENSDAVAFVLISSAVLVRGSNDPANYCGVKYSGEITKSFKGSPKRNNQIEFGQFVGLEVGREYLLFLNSEKVYEPLMSIGGTQAKQREEHAKWASKNCHSMPALKVNFGGRGALPVIWTRRWESKGITDGVLAPSRYISFPLQVPKGPYSGDDETYPQKYSEWVVGSREKLEKVLEGFKEEE